jgi:hypothetical protein
VFYSLQIDTERTLCHAMLFLNRLNRVVRIEINFSRKVLLLNECDFCIQYCIEFYYRPHMTLRVTIDYRPQ